MLTYAQRRADGNYVLPGFIISIFSFFYNEIQLVQSPRATLGLQIKSCHSKQVGNTTKTQVATGSVREGKGLRRIRKSNSKQQTIDEPVHPFKRPGRIV